MVMKQSEQDQRNVQSAQNGGTGESSDKEFLRTEPLGRLLLKLALPTVAAQLINMLYNIVDRIYIGHIPEIGATALTGVGVCMPLIMIVSAFAALVGYGGAPRASIFMGKKDKESAEKTLGNCFVLQIIISVILTAVLWLLVMVFPGGFAAMFTSDAQLMEYTKTALRIYMGSMFLFGIQMACQMTFNALGKAAESIIVAVMRKFILLIPLIYIMPRIIRSNQTMAVYMAEPIADLLAVTFTAILFAVQFKKTLKNINKQAKGDFA